MIYDFYDFDFSSEEFEELKKHNIRITINSKKHPEYNSSNIVDASDVDLLIKNINYYIIAFFEEKYDMVGHDHRCEIVDDYIRDVYGDEIAMPWGTSLDTADLFYADNFWGYLDCVEEIEKSLVYNMLDDLLDNNIVIERNEELDETLVLEFI